MIPARVGDCVTGPKKGAIVQAWVRQPSSWTPFPQSGAITTPLWQWNGSAATGSCLRRWRCWLVGMLTFPSRKRSLTSRATPRTHARSPTDARLLPHGATAGSCRVEHRAEARGDVAVARGRRPSIGSRSRSSASSASLLAALRFRRVLRTAVSAVGGQRLSSIPGSGSLSSVGSSAPLTSWVTFSSTSAPTMLTRRRRARTRSGRRTCSRATS
jgi:hypothetical protein